MRFFTRYMDNAIFDLATVIERARRDLADVDFDTMVGTGFSGSIVIPSLALAMEKKFVLFRKETDDSHHGKGRAVGEMGDRWIFVDDFVSTGRTRERVIQKVNEVLPDPQRSEMVGQYLYQHASSVRSGFEPFDPSWGRS